MILPLTHMYRSGSFRLEVRVMRTVITYVLNRVELSLLVSAL